MQFTKKNPPLGFYVYLYLRENDSEIAPAGTPYYVGKGSKDRAWVNHNNVGKPVDQKFIKIFAHSLSEDDAFALEFNLTKSYGRIANNTGILRNLTEGGGGTSGYQHSAKTKTLISKASKSRTGHWLGKKMSDDTKEKMSKSQKARVRDTSVNERISAAKKGKSNGRTGFKHSEETKIKMAEARKRYYAV